MAKQSNELFKNWTNAYTKGDAQLLQQCYAENAELKVIDRDHPPSSPRLLKGRPAIAGFFNELFSREGLTHKIESSAVDENSLAVTEVCRYPNGSQVVSTDMCQLKNGKIERQTTVQAWDA